MHARPTTVGLRRTVRARPRSDHGLPEIWISPQAVLSGAAKTIMGMSNTAELSMTEALRQEYEEMLVRLERSRQRADRLRDLAAQASDQVIAEERLLKSLAEVLGVSAQATIHDLGGALRGQRLREVAVDVLRKHARPGEEVHYRHWFDLLRGEDIVVAGRDPLATFLAQVSRSDAVEAVGGRTGRYRLRAVA